ncbi:hypothetical protein [Roseibium marinum]|uniref:Uncharacterized protein n=1 Tax=Roseibium marinum TaxID=281252 RepID=A0A2S3V3V2_9HYPH|nr:hypothetical protein [Roseibium marinum]POF34667.1 hypothetical protein CLV41_1011125 [Roseibium marinum]
MKIGKCVATFIVFLLLPSFEAGARGGDDSSVTTTEAQRFIQEVMEHLSQIPDDAIADGPSETFSGTDGEDERDPKLTGADDYSDTRDVVWLIMNDSNECLSGLLPEYRIDCMVSVFARASSTMEQWPNYWEAGEELRKLSRKLNGIVSKYADPNAPDVTEKKHPYRAVFKTNLARANQETVTAIDETVTRLLRSVGDSKKRKVHYSRIAAAVGSTKRLLRS